MKRITATILALVTGLSLVMMPGRAKADPPTSPIISLATDKETYQVGEPVTLTVSTGPTTDLYGATVDVYFDTELLELDLSGTSAASVITDGLDATRAYNRVVADPAHPDRVSLIALRLGIQSGAGGFTTGTLGTVTFTAKANGSVTFTAKAAGGGTAAGDVVVQLASSLGEDIPPLTPGATVTFSIGGTAATGTLSGTVTLDGRVANKGGATVDLFQGDTLKGSTTTDAANAFTIPSLPVGTYTAYIRRSSYLSVKATVTISDSQTTIVTWTLYPGDISDSAGPEDRVFLEDLLAMAKAWNTSDALADLNGDGTVNGDDLQLLDHHWGETGADYAPPTN